VEKHVRPLIGHVQVGAVDADVFDSFYAELRRCREHCTGARLVEHRTSVARECDAPQPGPGLLGQLRRVLPAGMTSVR
jgi:hypothetical protein